MHTSPPDANVEHARHRALLRLLAAAGPLAPRRLLLKRHRDPLAALHAGPSAWRAAGLSARQCAALSRPPPPQALAWLHGDARHLIGWHDADYPPLLRHAPNPPLALFVAGDPSLLLRPSVAIVGSRAATAAGREHAARFAYALAEAGLAIGSGLAAGIDAAAHRAALAAPGTGPTYAVLGCGVDIAYPASHRTLLASISSAGAAVSEYLPGTAPRREHFPCRNRILAGLALATIVIEAGTRSGALITARLAAEAGREVFALPGSIRNPLSRGCHRLIRDGAGLAESADDIIAALGDRVGDYAASLRRRLRDAGPAPTSGPEPPSPATGTAAHDLLWQHLGHDPSTIDELLLRTGLTAAELSSMLLLMELEGRVVVEHGQYARRA